MTKPMQTLIPMLALAPAMLFSQATTPAPAAAPAAPVAPSRLVQPALTNVESTLNALKMDKWKKGSVREEADDNVKAILRDLKTNVPPLLADADAAPGVLSKSMPLLKHLDALYDVVLRVEEGARVSAPSDQIDQLESILKQFGSARIQFYDAMTERAAWQEKHVSDLQATIKAQQAAAEEHKSAPAAPAPCTPPKPAAHKKRATPKTAPTTPGQPAQTPPAQTPPAQPKTQ
jgi:hypothetical protein